MKVQIEIIKQHEFEIAIQLLKELYIELGEEKESVKFLDNKLLKRITDSGITEIFLAKTLNFEVVGIMTITECQSIYAGGKYGHLDEMYIKPDFRSNKIGTAMLEVIKEIGKEKKWNRIDVTAPTEVRWKRTVTFYEKSGFIFTWTKNEIGHMKLPLK